MSRAFTKEIDDAPPPPLPERPVSAAPNLVTARGAGQIEAEAAAIERQLGVAADAREIATLQRDRRYWAARLASMQVMPAVTAPNAIKFGTAVELRRTGRTLQMRIVGEDEADPAAGLIAWTSPLAVALDGAEPGESIEFAAGGRTETIEILGVSP